MSEQKPTSITIDDDEKERARLAAQWLLAGISQTYQAAPIDWEQKGLRAEILLRVRNAPVIDGHWNYVKIGDLLSVYSHMREEDNFLAWLRAKMGDHRSFLDDGTVVLPHNERVDTFIETLPAGIKSAAESMRSNEDGLLYPYAAVRMWREYPSQTEDGREIRGSGSHWECVGFVRGRGWLGEVLAKATGNCYETWSLFPFNAARGPHILDYDPDFSKRLHGKEGRYTDITEENVREYAYAYIIDTFQIHQSNLRYVEILSCEHDHDHHANWACRVQFSASQDQVVLAVHSGGQGLEVFAHRYGPGRYGEPE